MYIAESAGFSHTRDLLLSVKREWEGRALEQRL